MSPEKIKEIFSRFEKQNPDPRTELNYTTDFTFVVAVILSAQSTDKGVNKATKELFKKITSAEEMIQLGEEGLKKYIHTIGLYNNKAKNIIALSKELIEKYQGKIPSTREGLEELPGIGRKTGNVILNVLFHQPFIGIDTHILRIVPRMGIATGKTPKILEEKLEKILPEKYKHHANHWLVLHGRYICTAKKPALQRMSYSRFM